MERRERRRDRARRGPADRPPRRSDARRDRGGLLHRARSRECQGDDDGGDGVRRPRRGNRGDGGRAPDAAEERVIEGLECAACGTWAAADSLRNLCPACSGPLLARYDLESLARGWRPADLVDRVPGVWRWREVLPIAPGEEPLTLGEGGTPLLRSRSIGPALGMPHLAFKDESRNPTLSFKARGLAVAIHRARALGARHVAIPSAGNAGSATAAYCAVAGLPCTVAMPSDTPPPIVNECRAHGARIQLVAGTIADAGAWIRERAAEEGWFDVSTLREPYRLEGKKTMGYELAESGGWELPAAIVYPTG